MFDELVAAVGARLTRQFAGELPVVSFGVADLPPTALRSGAPSFARTQDVPLGEVRRSARSGPCAIVVFRRPIEIRTSPGHEREALVHDVLVEQVAALLGVSPEDVDPYYPNR